MGNYAITQLLSCLITQLLTPGYNRDMKIGGRVEYGLYLRDGRWMMDGRYAAVDDSIYQAMRQINNQLQDFIGKDVV